MKATKIAKYDWGFWSKQIEASLEEAHEAVCTLREQAVVDAAYLLRNTVRTEIYPENPAGATLAPYAVVVVIRLQQRLAALDGMGEEILRALRILHHGHDRN